jgi:hypothetical protein
MRHRDVVAVDGVGARDTVAPGRAVPDLVGDDLVSPEVPVRPAGVRAAAFEAEDVAVELARDLDVVDRDGQVERGQGGTHLILSLFFNDPA